VLALFFILNSSTASAKVLIFDLGDVLFEKSAFGIMRSIGIHHFLGHIFLDWKSPTHLEKRLFHVLSQVPCAPLPEAIQARTAQGALLPPIMCHWQSGTIAGEEIIARTNTQIERLSEEGFFTSHREKKLVEKTIATMFNPKILAHNMHPIRSGVRLIEDCAQARNPDGTQKNYLIALSNWDPISFDLLHDLNREVFEHFDGIAISGKTGFIKPRAAAFYHLIDTHQLDPQECLFIDDREENLEAAEALGFNTFHLKRGNYRELRNVLEDFGALN
jgi:putative hydrolase of the HAD superfamily